MATADGKTPPGNAGPGEVRIVAHSMLFYWWPVWVAGFVLALVTWIDGYRLAVVPAGTEAVAGVADGRDGLVLPAGAHLPADPATGKPLPLNLRVARQSGYGVTFIIVVLLVIFITNVPIRGLWSVVVIITILLGTIILSLAGLWDDILVMFSDSHVYINAFGYLAVAVPLFLLWLVVVLFFDRQMYMVFVPGQMRVCQEIGSGEAAFDAHGMVVEKRRSDLFRHWLLGLGSGDLVVKTSGANAQEFQLHNVLFVGSKLQMVQTMLQTREVTNRV
jgi:hypothetical protein